MHDQYLKDGQKLHVESYILHPYHKDKIVYEDYDIAISTTTTKMIFSRTVRPVCLPTGSENILGRTGIVAGW